MTHTEEKSFTCKTCLKKFSWSSHLNTHQLTHTGEKSFTCETCLKKFSQAGNLRTHQMTHTGEKSFECETCLKKFNRASKFSRHQHTHWGEMFHMWNMSWEIIEWPTLIRMLSSVKRVWRYSKMLPSYKVTKCHMPMTS